jgi:hypothetical protein
MLEESSKPGTSSTTVVDVDETVSRLRALLCYAAHVREETPLIVGVEKWRANKRVSLASELDGDVTKYLYRGKHEKKRSRFLATPTSESRKRHREDRALLV